MSANDCGKCGANLRPGAKFCASCGASVQNQPDQTAAPLYQNPAQQKSEQSPAPQMQSAAPQVGQPADSVSPGEEIAFHIDSQMIQENTKRPDIVRLIAGLAAAVLSFAAIWNAKSPVAVSALLSVAAIAVRIVIGMVRRRKK